MNLPSSLIEKFDAVVPILNMSLGVLVSKLAEIESIKSLSSILLTEIGEFNGLAGVSFVGMN